MYSRPLTAAMIHGLILLSKAPDSEKDAEGYIHVEQYLKKIDCPASVRGDLSKLRFWNFIAPKPGAREDGSNKNGYYRVLQGGINFIRGHSMVNSHVKIYNNRYFGDDGKMVNVDQVVKKRFDYNKLMRGEL